MSGRIKGLEKSKVFIEVGTESPFAHLTHYETSLKDIGAFLTLVKRYQKPQRVAARAPSAEADLRAKVPC